MAILPGNSTVVLSVIHRTIGICTPLLTFTHEFCAEIPDPPAFVAVRFIVKLPVRNVKDGFCNVLAVAYIDVFVPYPVIFQFQLVGDPVEVSVKVTASGLVPVEVTGVKDATGADGSGASVGKYSNRPLRLPSGLEAAYVYAWKAPALDA